MGREIYRIDLEMGEVDNRKAGTRKSRNSEQRES